MSRENAGRCLGRTLMALAVTALLLLGCSASAHNGVDHGGDSAAAQIHRVSEPRFSVRSETSEVVGILNNGALELFIDDALTNAPLDYTLVQVEVDGSPFDAERVDKGRYRIPAATLTAGRTHHLILTLLGDSRQDLLAATFQLPSATGIEEVTASRTIREWVAVLVITLVVGLVLWLIRSGLPGRRMLRLSFDLVVATGIAIGVVMGSETGFLKPGPQRDIEPMATGPLQLQITRLSDGSLFVPKPTQRKLGIRTMLPVPTRQRGSLLLPGKVLADPSTSANLKAALSGVVSPPPGGFPKPGATIAKAQVLAHLTPAIAPAERASKEAELAFIERDIYLTGKQLKRLESQTVMQQDNSILLDIRRAELVGLQKKRKALRKLFDASVEIRAPVAGRLSGMHITAGQTVSQGEPLFEIFDPRHLWVEVIAYDDLRQADSPTAHIRTADDESVPLEFIGTPGNRQGLGQAYLFGIADPASFAPGEMVEVNLFHGESLTGVAISAQALSLTARGDTVVWTHIGPERFAPKVVDAVSRPVRQERFIAGDWSGREPAVTRGAALLSAAH